MEETEPFFDDQDVAEQKQKPPRKLAISILRVIAVLSISLNIILSLVLLHRHNPDTTTSPYAHLARVREEPFVRLTPYSSANQTLQDALWDAINIDDGVVALPDAFVAQHDLRRAQRFPWDPSKGIYILHGFHNLHCLKIIQRSLSEFRRGVGVGRQSRAPHHVDHCLDALRRQVLCDADDTPRATERRPEVVSGVLQHRMCRRWGDLVAFARRHTACYRRPEDPDADQGSRLERFKHCPEGSGYVVTDDYVPLDELVVGLPEESVESEATVWT